MHAPSTFPARGSVWAGALAAAAPPAAWRRLSAGDGAKGPRLYDWASARLPERDEDEPIGRWLLLRRNISDPTDIAYYLCGGPAGTPMTELVRVAGARWAIEECFQAAKNETGLDQYEVRRHQAWYRHITLAMLAHAFLAVMAAQEAEKGAPATIRTHSCHSPWQRSGDSWQL